MQMPVKSWMIGGMGVLCVLLGVFLILGVAAFVKYLFFGRKG